MTKMIKKEVTIMIQKANFERCELDGAGCQIIFSSGMLKIRGNIFKKTAPGTSTCRACGNKIKKGDVCISFQYDFDNNHTDIVGNSIYSSHVYIHDKCEIDNEIHLSEGDMVSEKTLRRFYPDIPDTEYKEICIVIGNEIFGRVDLDDGEHVFKKLG